LGKRVSCAKVNGQYGWDILLSQLLFGAIIITSYGSNLVYCV